MLWNWASFWKTRFSSCRLAGEGGTTTAHDLHMTGRSYWFHSAPIFPERGGNWGFATLLLCVCLLQRGKDPSAPILLPGGHHHQDTRLLFTAGFQIRMQSSQGVYFAFYVYLLLIYVYFLNLWSVPWIIYPRHFPASSIFMIALHGVDFSSIHYIAWKMVH